MSLASITTRIPHLVQTLETLAQREHHSAKAESLLHELAGITVLVARKFTNEKTADGVLEAFYLTTGCVSLGLSQSLAADELSYLLQHGAEQVFQSGFRAIRELSALPVQTLVMEFDRDPQIQQRDVKALFVAICRAHPDMTWTGDEIYRKALLARQENQRIIECAKWLRQRHFAGPVKEADLDAVAVISIAVIFAISGDGRIVARIRQKDLEQLIRGVRESKPDIEAGWRALLQQTPGAYREILSARIDEFRTTIVRKMLSKNSLVKVVAEIQNCYAGCEQDVDY